MENQEHVKTKNFFNFLNINSFNLFQFFPSLKQFHFNITIFTIFHFATFTDTPSVHIAELKKKRGKIGVKKNSG